MSLNQAAKYFSESLGFEVSQPLLSTWVKRGEITVLRRPEVPGDKLMVDAYSVWERLKTFKPRLRSYGQRHMAGTAQRGRPSGRASHTPTAHH